VDAALSKNSSRASAAAVARDEARNFLGAPVVMMLGITELEIMEALALREGMALAKDLSLCRVRMPSDCAKAVRSMKGPTMGVYGQIIRELKEEAATFQLMEIVHEKREASRDAHSLARSTLFMEVGRYVWFFDPSDGVCISFVNS